MRLRNPQRSDVGELQFKCLKHDTIESVPGSDPLLMVTLFFLSFKLMYGFT